MVFALLSYLFLRVTLKCSFIRSFLQMFLGYFGLPDNI
jgi:hypothetical protein